MAVIETWLHQDLQEPVKVNHLDGNLFSNNGNGNRIGVVLTNNGEALASISGTVSGYVVTADGSTVPCTGSKSGNRASILIPAAAYQPGSIFITVFVTDGTTVTTIGAVSTTVMRSRTNAQVGPGSAVTDWTQTINAAMQSVETAAANLGGIVAVPYASITFPVPLGKYTYYNNNLYRCITPIESSESFTAAHWTQVRLGDDVSDLKSAINTQIVPEIDLLARWHIVSTGKWAEDARYNCEYFAVNSGDEIVIEPNSNGSPYAMLKSINIVNGGTPDYATGYSNWKLAHSGEVITAPSDAKFILYRIKDNTTPQKPVSISYNGYQMYTPMYEHLTGADERISAAEEDIDNAESNISVLQDETAVVVEEERTINLIDPNNIQTGKYCSSSDLTISSSGTYNLATVPVEEGVTYTFKSGKPLELTEFVPFRFAAFATENMEGGFTVLDGSSVSVSSHGEFTVPEGAAFVLLSYNPSSSYADGKPMLVKGDIAKGYIEYVQYGISYKSKISLSDIVDFSTHGKNLIDTSKSETGFIQKKGNVYVTDSYKTTEYIPVKANTTYVVSPRARAYALFGTYKNMLAYNDTSSNDNRVISATSDGYVRITYYADEENVIMCEEGSTSTPFEPYKQEYKAGYDLNSNQKKNVGDDILRGKKAYFCGDSFTEGGYTSDDDVPESVYIFQDGKYAGKQKTYPYFIGLRTGLEVHNIAVSGTTMAYDTSVIPSRYQADAFSYTKYTSIPNDADYIILKYGINDSGYGITVGAIDDNTNATFYGAWNVVMAYLIEHHPFAKIGIIVTNGCQNNSSFPEAIKNIAKKWGVPYLDEAFGEDVPLLLRTNKTNVTDTAKTIRFNTQVIDAETNWHPNVQTQEYESTFVETWMKTL